MLSGTIISFFLCFQASANKYEPYLVKAVIDTAVIIGLPPSREAKAKAREFQKPDFLSSEAGQSSPIVGWRKLYFSTHFQ